MLLSVLVAATAKPLAILFIGNSHTAYNDLPGMVRNLLVSGEQIKKVTTKSVTGGLLNDQAASEGLKKEISSGKWNVIVLQGAMVSSSHKYKYKQDGGIQLAKLAKKSGARTLLFAEWPRKGWDEAQYIMQVYEEIARASLTEIVPIPYVFRTAINRVQDLNLWQADGNHATSIGTYLASLTLYYWISNQHLRDPNWAPKGMSYNLSRQLTAFAKGQHQLSYPD